MLGFPVMAPISIYGIYNSFSKASGCVCPSEHKEDFTSMAQGTQEQWRIDPSFTCCYALLRIGKKLCINSKQNICLASKAAFTKLFKERRTGGGCLHLPAQHKPTAESLSLQCFHLMMNGNFIKTPKRAQ